MPGGKSQGAQKRRNFPLAGGVARSSAKGRSMGKLHLGLRKAMSHRSMLAALNRLPKHLWGLNTASVVQSYRG